MEKMDQKPMDSWIPLACTFLLGLLASTSASAELRFHWESRFTTAEKQKLTRWLGETNTAMENLVGELPFDVHLYLHRTRAGEPVPWANTERSYRQGVHFHVDPRFSLEDFRKDWTAPHEMSHLIIPYVGRRYSWFAEGFASFMQYQLMHEMGVLSEDAMEKRYSRNIGRAERNYWRHSHRPFADAAVRLRREGKYSTFYWGGATFFLQVNDALIRTESPGLVSVLRDYVVCCRGGRRNLTALIADLDEVSDSQIFSDSLTRFRSQPGFPSYRTMIASAMPQ